MLLSPALKELSPIKAGASFFKGFWQRREYLKYFLKGGLIHPGGHDFEKILTESCTPYNFPVEWEGAPTFQDGGAEIAAQNAVASKKENEGFSVIRSDDYRILLDFDQPFVPFQHYGNERVWKILVQQVGVEYCRFYPSESGNTHCVVYLKKPLYAIERLVIQVALGSDPVREMLGLVRILHGVEEPSMLFSPPPYRAVSQTGAPFGSSSPLPPVKGEG